MRRLGFALLVAAAATAASAGVASAATPYDGRWSVVIQTRQGACDAAYRYGLVIVNGIVGYDGGGLDVRGRVGPGGAVRVRVSSGRSYADGSGRLSRTNGSGTWKGVGNGVCSGYWYAEKR